MHDRAKGCPEETTARRGHLRNAAKLELALRDENRPNVNATDSIGCPCAKNWKGCVTAEGLIGIYGKVGSPRDRGHGKQLQRTDDEIAVVVLGVPSLPAVSGKLTTHRGH